ncbi:MAG: pseudouridine synthase, partial [Planctomycetia bacterium]
PSARANSRRRGDLLASTIAGRDPEFMESATPDLKIIHEDESLIVLVKPAGVPTANAPRGAASMYAIMQGRRPPGAFLGVVSRLDAPVSGVLAFAATKTAAAALAAQFRDHTVTKDYVAVVEGRFPAPLGQWVDWHDSLERHAEDEAAGTAAASAPRAAHVRARVVKRAGEVSLVELAPSTGRRHQLREQLARRGCPIVGDRRYGARLPFPGGIALHARRLTVAHPASGQPCTFEAPLPPAWERRFPNLLPATGSRLLQHARRRRPGRGGRQTP